LNGRGLVGSVIIVRQLLEGEGVAGVAADHRHKHVSVDQTSDGGSGCPHLAVGRRDPKRRGWGHRRCRVANPGLDACAIVVTVRRLLASADLIPRAVARLEGDTTADGRVGAAPSLFAAQFL